MFQMKLEDKQEDVFLTTPAARMTWRFDMNTNQRIGVKPEMLFWGAVIRGFKRMLKWLPVKTYQIDHFFYNPTMKKNCFYEQRPIIYLYFDVLANLLDDCILSLQSFFIFAPE